MPVNFDVRPRYLRKHQVIMMLLIKLFRFRALFELVAHINQFGFDLR